MQPVPRFSLKVDILALYTEDAMRGGSASDLFEKIQSAYKSVNEAMKNSEINLNINLVGVLKVSPGVERARQHGK